MFSETRIHAPAYLSRTGAYSASTFVHRIAEKRSSRKPNFRLKQIPIGNILLIIVTSGKEEQR
jgi:hypothetical protein